MAALCQRLADDVRYEQQRSTTTANLVAESSTRVAEMDISHGLIRDYMRRRPLSPVDLTVEIREEDEELMVPESPVWDRVSVDEEIDPNDIGDDLREAAIHWGRGDLETSGNILGKLWALDHFSPNVSTNHILGTFRL